MSQIQRRGDVLPVPPELRNHIYDYLLAADQVREVVSPPDADSTQEVNNSANQLYGSAAHIYRMHTAILRLNHSTRDEAVSRLYKSNTFVKVTYNCLGLTEMLHRCSVPMICDNTAICQKLMHFSMEVVVTSVMNWGECDQSNTCFIIAAQDLPILCQSLQALLFGCVNRRDTYLPLKNGGVRSFDCSEGIAPVLLTFHLHGTKYKKMTVQLENYLLRPFEDFDFIASSCRVTGSVRDPDQIVRIEEHIATKTVWLNAWIWRYLDIIQKGFTRALKLLHDGHTEAAESYADTVTEVDPTPYLGIVGKHARSITTELKQCSARLYVAMLDLSAVSWVAYLRGGNYDGTAIEVDSMLLAHYKGLSELAAHDKSLMVLRSFEQNADPKYAAGIHPDYLWMHALSELLLQDEPSDECWERHIAILAEVVKIYPEKQYIMHDLEILETTYHDSKLPTGFLWHDMKDNEKIKRLSITQFDKLNLGTPGHGDFLVPEGIRGFIDVENNKALQEGRLTVIG